MKLWPWRGRRGAREQELNREIEWHLNEIAEEREAEGLSRQQALSVARRDFGNDVLIREDTRQVWGWLWIARLSQDGRYALRLLARSPGFTAVAVLVFALGIGADRTLLRERLLATLSGFFALLGLTVAAAGLYGLMSFRVTRRRSEIGIRTALGAQRADILALILREALLLVSAGAAAGLLMAWPATNLLASLLYGLNRFDAVTIAGAVGSLVAVSLIAAWLPARRALRIDTLTALRYE